MRRFLAVFSYVWAGIWLYSALVVRGMIPADAGEVSAWIVVVTLSVPLLASLGLALWLDNRPPRRIAVGHTILWSTALALVVVCTVSLTLESEEVALHFSEHSDRSAPQLNLWSSLSLILPTFGLGGSLLVSGLRARADRIDGKPASRA
ncbi:MAG: hypothetical protein B7733_17385 [Myxococcales bacterium FL481]|nr:MAG: hypothetical protein B7733_17385 [Myxococcales bacterium FL481]